MTHNSDFPHVIVRKISLTHLLTIKRSQLKEIFQVNNSNNKKKGDVALRRAQSLAKTTSATST